MTAMQGDAQKQSGARSRSVPDFKADVLSAKQSKYCVVVPVINEGTRIQKQLERMQEAVRDVDVIVADGGSVDGSLERDFLRHAGVRAKLTKLGPGRLGAQLRMAYSWALDEGYEGIITIDGNGKDGVGAINGFRDTLADGADFIQGSRYAKGGEAVNTPMVRWFAGRFLFAPVLSAGGGHWYTEITNGFRGYSRRLLLDERVSPFRDTFMSYNLLFYLSVRAPQLGYRVMEYPVRRAYPDSGKVPTKITGRGAKVAIMGELVRSALGAFHPAPVGILGDRYTPVAPAVAWGMSLLVMAVYTMLALVAILHHGAPFAGEATLAKITPPQLPGLGAGLCSAGLIALSLERLRSLSIAPVVLALIFLSPHVIQHSISVEHGVFGILAMAIALYAASVAITGGDRTGFIWLGALLVAVAACTVPGAMIALAVGPAVLFWVLSRDQERRAALLRPCLVSVVVAILFAFLWYVLVVGPILEQQIAAYPDAYGNPVLSSMWPFWKQPGNGVLGLTALVLLAGMFAALRYQPLIAFILLLQAGLFAFDVAGALPGLIPGQLIFLTPISAILLVVGAVSLTRLAAAGAARLGMPVPEFRFGPVGYVALASITLLVMAIVAYGAALGVEHP
ncbi:hypothetical protein M3P21_17250 [Ruegeria sp. 2012CJ41-6]|uniref:Glycosyltransferase family 2 protein n=1 Tax=Ruegeria spongiae TaxID=2942209 RepID=A0ABT0Q5Y0_9RHOB|nr:hypothetical protein [Ruegeria spongiae]MCL6285278.1 hypothetical protein [Ruegeria spongiae]